MTTAVTDPIETADGDRLHSWLFAEIKNIPDVVRYWSRRRPESIALIEGSHRRSYRELDLRSSALANRLIELGLTRGANVGYLGKNSLEFFEIWFAAGKSAFALAAFNWRCSAEELVAIVEDAQTAIVFVGAEFLPLAEEVQRRCGARFEIVSFRPSDTAEDLLSWAAAASSTDPATLLLGGDTALLSYTSGTTGQPKGVMASHEAFGFSFLCGALEPAMAWRNGDIMVMSMPNFHLAGSWVSLAALYHGATLSILPAFEPVAFMQTLRRDRPTIAPLVPAAIQMLINNPSYDVEDFASLRAVMYFGSPIGVDLLKRATQVLNCQFHQFYGTTETWFLTILRHDQHVEQNAQRLTSCGSPLPLIGIDVRDADGQRTATGSVGEVWVRSPMAFTGYWRRPEATAEVMHEGWYRTGDLAWRDDEGFLYIVDRAKDMIISGGENIYSSEVEQALLKTPGVAICAAVGLPDQKWGERVVAAIVRSPQSAITEEEVIAHCRSLIAAYKAPKQVIFMEALPLTPTGKVKKAELRRLLTNAEQAA